MAKKQKRGLDAKWWIIGAIFLIIILVNLGGKDSPVFRSISKKLKPPIPTPTTIMEVLPPEGLDTDQANYVKLAREALAANLKMKSEDIKVVSVKPKQWNDSSLGCPQKGMLYIQSITPGYVIELSVRGRTYIYNGGLNKVISC